MALKEKRKKEEEEEAEKSTTTTTGSYDLEIEKAGGEQGTSAGTDRARD